MSVISSTCTGKIAHDTHAEALRSIYSRKKRRSPSAKGGAINTYRCSMCFRWHVGGGGAR